jgi:rRNA maturation RNase YbeY
MINFFKEDINFRLSGKSKLTAWIEKIIKKEGRKKGEVNFIFCNDPYLKKINKKYLNHDYFTDIVTFDTSMEAKELSGDIFISIDRVRANAESYKTSFENELHRVMAHGILHLSGYGDKNEKDQKEMRKMEEYWLMKF